MDPQKHSTFDNLTLTKGKKNDNCCVARIELLVKFNIRITRYYLILKKPTAYKIRGINYVYQTYAP